MNPVSRRGADTKRDLLAAVETLLTARSDLNVSLREITAAAGTNVAAVNYHFGSKDALIKAVMQDVMQERATQRLEALSALDDSATVEDVVQTWIEPLVARGGRPLYGRLLAFVMTSGSRDLRNMLIDSHREATGLYFTLLSARLPDLAPMELAFRISLTHLAVAGLVSGGAEGLMIPHDPTPDYLETTMRRTVSFIIGALSAPPSAGA